MSVCPQYWDMLNISQLVSSSYLPATAVSHRTSLLGPLTRKHERDTVGV